MTEIQLWVEYPYMEYRLSYTLEDQGIEREPRIIGPLLEELPLKQWLQIMSPKESDDHRL